MQNVQTLKNKGQERLAHLTENVKQAPSQTKTWGVTAGAAAAGALGLAAVGGLLASTPIALTVGAVAGGWLGWKYVHNQAPQETSTDMVADDGGDPVVESVPISPAKTASAKPATAPVTSTPAAADNAAIDAIDAPEADASEADDSTRSSD